MINQFLESVKSELTGKLSEQNELNSNQAEEASATVTNTFRDEFAEKARNGQLNDIKSLLGKDGASTGFAGSLQGKVAASLSGKSGIPANVATKIASVAVPFVINKLGNFASAKGKDSTGGIQEMLGGLGKDSISDNIPGGIGKKLGF